jgi:hypothetical protein
MDEALIRYGRDGKQAGETPCGAAVTVRLLAAYARAASSAPATP